MADRPLRVGILTVSDRVAAGTYADAGGPAVRAVLGDALATRWTDTGVVVPDDQDRIERALVALADGNDCDLVLTTGGTGPAPRDVTPEATAAVCTRLLPGIGEAMRAASQAHVPTAMLSRQTAGHRGSCLIVNLPGKPSAVRECLEVILPALVHAVALLGGPTVRLAGDHAEPHA